VRQALLALQDANDPPVFFDRGGILTRIRNHGGPADLEEVDDRGLLARLADAADWFRTNAKGEVLDADPPPNVIRAILGCADLPFAPIDGIAHAPFFALNSALVIQPGYHAESRTYLVLDQRWLVI